MMPSRLKKRPAFVGCVCVFLGFAKMGTPPKAREEKSAEYAPFGYYTTDVKSKPVLREIFWTGIAAAQKGKTRFKAEWRGEYWQRKGCVL